MLRETWHFGAVCTMLGLSGVKVYQAHSSCLMIQDNKDGVACYLHLFFFSHYICKSITCVKSCRIGCNMGGTYVITFCYGDMTLFYLLYHGTHYKRMHIYIKWNAKRKRFVVWSFNGV